MKSLKKLSHSTRQKIIGEVNGLSAVLKNTDRWYPHTHHAEINGIIYDAWDKQVREAVREISTNLYAIPPSQVISILSSKLSGAELLRHIIGTKEILENAFLRGKAESNAEFRRAGGKLKMQKEGILTGVLFGITESHAISALDNFLRLSAGGFWDDKMTEIIKDELVEYYQSNESRDDFAKYVMKVVNERLATDGKQSLPRSYFDLIAENTIVTTRTAAKVFKGKELGATGYRLRNPRDSSTSSICMSLTAGNEIYPFDKAASEISDILSASSLDDLKTKAPFHSSNVSGGRLTPPFHVRCRTFIELVFAGLNDE